MNSISFGNFVANQKRSCLKSHEKQDDKLCHIKRGRAFKEPEDDFLYKAKRDRRVLNKKVVKFDPIVTTYLFCPNNE